MRFQAKIPLKFWSHCAKAVVYLIDRVPSTILNGVSPFKKLYNKKPSMAHLRTLGCLCHAKVVQETDKLMSRTKHSVIMAIQKSKRVIFSMI